jgi:hypothetical protein
MLDDEERKRRDRERHRKRRTGASQEQFERSLEDQQERCADCGRAFVYKHRHPRSPVQDHFRILGETKEQETRGLPRDVLCLSCNLGGGSYGDDPVVMRRAADNRECWKAKEQEHLRKLECEARERAEFDDWCKAGIARVKAEGEARQARADAIRQQGKCDRCGKPVGKHGYLDHFCFTGECGADDDE